LKATGNFAIAEESFRRVVLSVFLVNVNGKDHSASCHHGGLVIEKSGVIELEFTDLESHILDGLVGVIIQYTHVSLHRLDGSWEIEIKA
jgi:hypothetical protein